MDLLSTGLNALVVGVVGMVLAWLGKGRFEAVEKRSDRLEGWLDSFQGLLGAMRSDLTQVALAVGAKPRASNR